MPPSGQGSRDKFRAALRHAEGARQSGDWRSQEQALGNAKEAGDKKLEKRDSQPRVTASQPKTASARSRALWPRSRRS